MEKELKTERDNFFVGAFINELLISRLVFGEKRDNDTMEDFLKIRALETIKKTPLNKFDAISEYKPLVYAEVSISKAKEVSAQRVVGTKVADTIIVDKETSITEKQMIQMLKDKGYTVFKRKKK